MNNKMIARLFQVASGALVGAVIGLQPIVTVSAQETAQQLTQVPGYYRQAVGDSVITAVYDGYLYVSTSVLYDINAKDTKTLLAKMFQQEDKDGVQTSVNAFLVKINNELVLIDSGAARCFGPTMGNLVDNIQAAGYSAEEVKKILLTHLHPDHACGLATEDGKAVFPNATIMLAEEEKDYWLDPKNEAAATETAKTPFELAKKSVAPYIAKNAVQTFKSGEQVLPGIDSIDTAGHTPGHTSYLIHLGKDSILVWGDLVHMHAIQFNHPEVSVEFDVDRKNAIESRSKIFEQATAEKWFIAGAHLPFPGIGHIRKEGQGYTWVPAEYSSLLK